ncbi:hypothetical protein QBC43DRAFT_120534 [Cladorrhinum sp. PSN259]|nr:hypothetical protein QBC43DRAFT_120534 [Cladorrhinum sp. PSN259]
MYEVITFMYSHYFTRLDPAVGHSGNHDSQAQQSPHKAGPLLAAETRVNAVSCGLNSIPSNDPKHDPPEATTFPQTFSFPDGATSDLTNFSVPRFLSPLIDLPLIGLFEGVWPLSDAASWSSRSNPALDVGDSAIITRQSTPITERSNTPSVTTSEANANQRSSSSRLWAWFRGKEVRAAGNTLEIKESNGSTGEQANGTLQHACLKAEFKHPRKSPDDEAKKKSGVGNCFEKSLGPRESDEGLSKVIITREKGSSMHHSAQTDSSHRKGEDNYWEWDRERQQFIHTDTDTGKAVACPNWFD